MNILEFEKTNYDASCKRVLSFKSFSAIILKDALKEVSDLSLQELIRAIEPENEKERIIGLNTEDLSIPEAKIVYDLLFILQTNNRRIIIDLEPQSSSTSYDLKKRALYYGCRLIDRQKNHPLGFKNSYFDDLIPVASVWIRNDTKNVKLPKEIINNNDDLQIVFLYPIKPDETKEPDSHELLYILFMSDKPFEARKEWIERRYGILITEEVEKELRNMCTFSEGLYNRGVDEGIEIGVGQGIEIGVGQGIEIGVGQGIEIGTVSTFKKVLTSLMEKQKNLDLNQAMELLDVPQDLRETLKKELH